MKTFYEMLMILENSPLAQHVSRVRNSYDPQSLQKVCKQCGTALHEADFTSGGCPACGAGIEDALSYDSSRRRYVPAGAQPKPAGPSGPSNYSSRRGWSI